MTEEQRAHLLGALAGDVVFFKGFGASLAYLQEIGALSKAEQKLASLVEAVDKIVETAPSEVVRVATVEGKVVEVQHKVSLFQKMGKEAVKDTKGTLDVVAKEGVKDAVKTSELIPEFMKGKGRIPLDHETILRKNASFKKTNYRTSGAAIYEKDKLFYYRDTFHKGKRAHLEVFNKAGKHLGEADPLTGKIIPNTADPTKKSPFK